MDIKKCTVPKGLKIRSLKVKEESEGLEKTIDDILHKVERKLEPTNRKVRHQHGGPIHFFVMTEFVKLLISLQRNIFLT